MIGWVVLGLPVAAYDPLKMPQFVWYYRGDTRVVKAMAGGLVGGLTLLVGLVYALWGRGAPLHGSARFANERELKRHGFRSASGIVVGRKGARFLTFGESEHVLVEAPTRSGKGTGIVIPNLLTWQGSVVVLDVMASAIPSPSGMAIKYRAAPPSGEMPAFWVIIDLRHPKFAIGFLGLNDDIDEHFEQRANIAARQIGAAFAFLDQQGQLLERQFR